MSQDESIRLEQTNPSELNQSPFDRPQDLNIVELPSTVVPVLQRLKGSLALPVVVVIILFTLIGAIFNPEFLHGSTWTVILESCSFTVIVACFEGLIMISGGIDLSVGSTFLAGAMTAAALAEGGHSDFVSVAGAFGVGLGVGLINGLLVNYVGISAIIATLGTMFAELAVVTTISQGISIGPLPERFTVLGQSSIGSLPSVVFIALGIAILVHVTLEYTTLGSQIRAIGGNREAARALGLNPKITSTSLYMLTGAFAALAGLLEAANLGAGDPAFGTDLELTVIAAVVIGGTSVYGAVGTVSGMVCGSILLSLITIGLVLLHLSGSMQDFAVGTVMVLACSVSQIRQSKKFRMSVKDALKEK